MVIAKLPKLSEIDANIVGLRNALNKEWYYKVRKKLPIIIIMILNLIDYSGKRRPNARRKK